MKDEKDISETDRIKSNIEKKLREVESRKALIRSKAKKRSLSDLREELKRKKSTPVKNNPEPSKAEPSDVAEKSNTVKIEKTPIKKVAKTNIEKVDKTIIEKADKTVIEKEVKTNVKKADKATSKKVAKTSVKKTKKLIDKKVYKAPAKEVTTNKKLSKFPTPKEEESHDVFLTKSERQSKVVTPKKTIKKQKKPSVKHKKNSFIQKFLVPIIIVVVAALFLAYLYKLKSDLNKEKEKLEELKKEDIDYSKDAFFKDVEDEVPEDDIQIFDDEFKEVPGDTIN